jgi:predicted LPLAT superfamily acyltransferase
MSDAPSNQSWEDVAERGTPFMLQLFVGSALLFGRRLMRVALWPIVGYFLLTSRDGVAASRAALRRILQREPAWRDVARNFYCFAACALDRIYLFKGLRRGLQIDVTRPPEVVAAARSGGSILLVAHLGSFEIMRAIGTGEHALPLSILMDKQQGRMLISLLEKLNPGISKSFIDAGQRGPQLVLKLREAVQGGRMVGIMADRTRADDRAIEVQFMGGIARLPEGPWMMAAAAGAPVILGFGLYRGGARYDVHFELFSEHIELAREGRAQMLQELAQRYALRLEHYTRLAPYNWFNYYAFWQ